MPPRYVNGHDDFVQRDDCVKLSFDPDADGLTPALNGLVLTERLRQATDTPEKLKSVDYRYAVTAAAPNGTKGEIGGYKPRTGETLVIVVKP